MVNLQKPPRGARINWADPITRGLVGCWLFNELTGDKSINLAKLDMHNIIGASWRNGELFFDGIDDKVILNNIEIEEEITLAIKASWDTSWDTTFDHHLFSLFPGIVISWRDWGYNYMRCFAKDTADNEVNAIFGTSSEIDIFEKYTYIATYDLSGLKVYLNGKQKDTTTALPNSLKQSDGPRIGTYYNTDDYAWKGRIEYAYKFNRALTDDEIRRLSAEPYSFLETPSSRAYFYVASGTTVSLDLGALSLTGYDISVQAGASVSMELGELALSGYDVSVQVGVNVIIAMESGAISLSDDDVVVNIGVTVSMEIGELSFTGYDINAGTATTVSIKITTTEAQAISGALVTIGDSFSETTDSNGEVSGNIIPGTYTLIITKAGYQTYQAQIEITGSIDWQIALNKQVGIIITGCGASVNLGPRNPTNVLYT